MQIRRLRLLNFRQHADTTIELDLGLTGIIGPNGAGKTTLLEAIAWAIYGTPAVRGTRDSIRRRSAPARSRVEVELDFRLGAHEYRLTRSLQSAALHLDGEPAPIANSAAAVTDHVTRVLGMTRDEFFNTYFTGQKELAIMAAMSGPDRARFLSRVLGYERLAAAQVRLKETRTALRASCETAERGLVDLASMEQEEREADSRLADARAGMAAAAAQLESAIAAVADAAPAWEAMQRREKEFSSLNGDVKIAERDAAEARRAFEQLDRELAETLAAKARRDELLPELADWDTLVGRREQLDAEAQAFAGRRALEAQAAEVRTAVAALAEKLSRLAQPPELDAARRDLAAAHEAMDQAARRREEQHAAWVRDKQDAETKREHLLRQRGDVAKQLRRLRDTGPTVVCPTCGKPLGKEYDAVLEDLQAQLDEIVLQGKFYRKRIDQLAMEPPALVEARRAWEQAETLVTARTTATAKLEAALAERQRLEQERVAQQGRLAELEARLAAAPARYDEALHQSVKARLAGLESVRDQITRLTVVADRAVDLVPKATEAEQTLSRAEALTHDLRQRLTELGWSQEAYEALRARYHEVEREQRETHLRTIQAEGQLTLASERRAGLIRRRQERDRRAAELERLRGELLLNQELDRAYSDLREELNAGIRPELSDVASGLLHDLTGGRYDDLELGEDYSPIIVDDGEPKPVISGGEEDVANLALRLAISQMIAERSGQPLSLLVLDEIFGSLDEERRTAVLDLLRGLAGRFPQVILITHVEAVRDGVDRVIRIEYDPERGIATAREERPPIEVPHVAA
jgi:exonuclease SbcC